MLERGRAGWALWMSLCAAGALAADESPSFYMMDGVNDLLYRVESDPVQSSLIGEIAPLVPDEITTSVALENAHRLYLIDRQNQLLMRVSTHTGGVLTSVPLERPVVYPNRGFDVHPNGDLYALIEGLHLYTIDPSTGNTTFVTDITGTSQIECIAFGPDGTLYAASEVGMAARLYRIDATSGATTVIGDTTANDIDGLTYGDDGYLYGTDADGPDVVYQIDPVTAATVVLDGPLTHPRNGLACTVPVADRCDGDVSGDGDTDQADLGLLLALYGSCDGDGDYSPLVDVDGDGCIGQSDLGELLGDYGCGT
jgi:hypothetical protein